MELPVFRIRTTQRVPRRRCLLLLLAVAGCHDLPTAPERVQSGIAGPSAVHGVMTVTIAGLSSATPHASASLWSPAGARRDLIPVGTGTDEGIQLNALSTSSFTTGVRGAGGQRYITATFRVRNASAAAVPYATPRTNLTLVAVGTASNLGATAVAELRRFDGTPASAAIATQVIPTGAAILNAVTGQISSAGPDVLQVFSEEEVAALPAQPGVTTVFPYGFVVRNASSVTTRTLPASPDGLQLDGIVTFAFRVPLQPTEADDPYTMSITLQAVDDPTTRITQSVEEQSPDAVTAFQLRAEQLNTGARRLLAGGSLPGASPVWESTQVCSVRIAGTAASPAAYLFPTASDAPALPALLSPTGAISVVHSIPWSTPNAANFVVNGRQSGRAFVAGTYAGGGTTTIRTPDGNWFAGEEVDVALTSSLSCPKRVASLRVASGAASGSFALAGTSYPSADARSVVLADLDGDHKLDLVMSHADGLGVRMGVGDGSFGPETRYYGDRPNSSYEFALLDWNRDGRLDLVLADVPSTWRVIRLNNGDGTFGPESGILLYTAFGMYGTFATGDIDADGNLDLAIGGDARVATVHAKGDGLFDRMGFYWGNNVLRLGDIDGDGKLDLVATSTGNGRVSVFRGFGDAYFADEHVETSGLGVGGQAALGDLNGDGKLDLAIRGRLGGISVMLSRGNGTFGPPTLYPTRDPGSNPTMSTAMVLADVNGDGYLDMISDSNEGLDVMLGHGDGTFAPAFSSPTDVSSFRTVALDVGDLNGDGRLDLVFIEGATSTLQIRLGQP